ncbi:hypothetical protein SKAU_G00312820 [Synaphobranchus kaupii]|uniref:Uncharacterized protein n=1 Tax=Synaphobranchus kaupii TaxID=118154 RepID=A0A9Q1ES74_SYNKA|nr:hypothetical protein SKAU_G00312820 [Synaphobranchus kaupii]
MRLPHGRTLAHYSPNCDHDDEVSIKPYLSDLCYQAQCKAAFPHCDDRAPFPLSCCHGSRAAGAEPGMAWLTPSTEPGIVVAIGLLSSRTALFKGIRLVFADYLVATAGNVCRGGSCCRLQCHPNMSVVTPGERGWTTPLKCRGGYSVAGDEMTPRCARYKSVARHCGPHTSSQLSAAPVPYHSARLLASASTCVKLL